MAKLEMELGGGHRDGESTGGCSCKMGFWASEGPPTRNHDGP